jgi:N-acetylmuramoyl-L-alanine amidase
MTPLRPLALAIAVLCLIGTAVPAPARPARACDPATFHAVLDVGHSAEVPGATSARGVPEYAYNLRLATRMRDALVAEGFPRTELLVTPGSSFAGLIARTAHANRARADLFVSVHHDSVPEAFLDYWEHGGERRHFSDRFRGHSIFVSKENAALADSLRFARLLGLELKAAGMTYTPHYAEAFMGRRQRQLLDDAAGIYRFDELHVLRRTTMPAVLFEAGSIVNRDEELLLGTDAYLDLIAAAAVRAVRAYCPGRAPAPAAARSRQG